MLTFAFTTSLTVQKTSKTASYIKIFFHDNSSTGLTIAYNQTVAVAKERRRVVHLASSTSTLL